MPVIADTFEMTVLSITALMMLVSSYTDVRWGKVYNWCTLTTALIGLGLHTYHTGLSGLWFSAGGWLTGVALLFIPFFTRGMGAGDVKMLAAVGAMMGPEFTFYTFLWGASVGAVMAVGYMASQGGLMNRLKSTFVMAHSQVLLDQSFKQRSRKENIPYGVAIAVGGVLAYIIQQ